METARISTNVYTGEIRAASSTKQNAAAFGGGDFMAIIDQMLAGTIGMQGIGGENALFNKPKGDGEEEQQQNAMEMLSMFFADGNTLQDITQGAGNQILNDVQNLDKAQQLLQLFIGGNKANITDAAEIQNLAKSYRELIAQQNPSEMQYEVLSTKQNPSDGTFLNMRYFNDIQKIQANLMQSADEEGQPIDIDKLQKNADNSKFIGGVNLGFQGLVQNEQAQKLSGDADINLQSLLKQVENGIYKGVQSGKNEFVIKLKPEGLGEITVKMAQDNSGAISLNILTTSQQVSRLLNGDINSLRTALEPYNAHVETIVTAESENGAFNSFFSQNGNSYNGRHGRQSGGEQQSFFYEEQEQAQGDITPLEGLNISMLNAYI